MIGNTSYGPTSRTTTTDVGPLASMPNYQGLMDWARKLAIWRRSQAGAPASSSPRGELGGAVASSHVDSLGPATVPPNSSPAPTGLFATPFHGGVGMTGGMSTYVPGAPVTPGQGPVATGYLPSGYTAPTLPGSATIGAPQKPITGASEDLSDWLSELARSSAAKRVQSENQNAMMHPMGA